MDYNDKRSEAGVYNFIRPECVVREENLQLWEDVIKLEQIRKQKVKAQHDAILRANLQLIRKF